MDHKEASIMRKTSLSAMVLMSLLGPAHALPLSPLAVPTEGVVRVSQDASRYKSCLRSCAGFRQGCASACMRGETSAFKGRELREVRCKGQSTTSAAVQDCIRRERRKEAY